jgi:predicted esterase
MRGFAGEMICLSNCIDSCGNSFIALHIAQLLLGARRVTALYFTTLLMMSAATVASTPLVDLKNAEVSAMVDLALENGEVLPPVHKHESTLIFLHGLGDQGSSWASELIQVRQKIPNTKIVCPTAPTTPVTCNRGARMPAWHDIVDFEKIGGSPEGLDDPVTIVKGLIQREIDAGIPAEKIVLGGFSQGAALSLYVGYGLQQRLAGVVALSGYGVRVDEQRENAKLPNRPRVFIGHGLLDDVVPFASGDEIAGVLKAGSAENDVHVHEYANVAHSTSAKEMNDMLSFVRACLYATSPL